MSRLYVAGSRGKNEIVLEKGEAHYLRDVLRLKKGDRIAIFDRDEGEGFIRDISRNNAVIDIKNWKKIERQIGVSITLGQSILKGEKMDMVVEKAAEIGVASIIPLVSERVIPRRSGKEKTRRWERIVSQSAGLCGRPTPPQISAPISLNEFSRKNFTGLKIIPWEGEKETMLFEILSPRGEDETPIYWCRSVAQATVVMGPEGGFSQGEVNLLRKAKFETVSLGPFILRSETATIFTLSCLAGFYSSKGDCPKIYGAERVESGLSPVMKHD